jgi:putative salt-induced outer membrane protein
MKTIGKAAFVLWLAAAGTLQAQAPPCPCPEPPPPPPPVWFGSVDFSYLATSGNTDTSSLGGAFELNYKPTPWLFQIKANYLRSESNDELTSELFRGGFRASRDLTERIDIFTGVGYLRNTFAGINSLVLLDGGAGYKLLLGPQHFLRSELGFGYAWEDQVIGFDRNYANARAALNYKWQFSKTAFFTNDFSFLFDFDDTDNFIITDTAAITAALTKVFAIKASWSIIYDNVPVIGFDSTDTATAVSLVAKF